jgi:hypothetical protein
MAKDLQEILLNILGLELIPIASSQEIDKANILVLFNISLKLSFFVHYY